MAKKKKAAQKADQHLLEPASAHFLFQSGQHHGNPELIDAKKRFSKWAYRLLVFLAVFLFAVVAYRTYYTNPLDDALNRMISGPIGQSKVSVTTASKVSDLVTYYNYENDRTDILYDDYRKQIRVVDLAGQKYLGIKIDSEYKWAKINSDENLEDFTALGYPAERLVERNPNLPIIPVGNFTEEQRNIILPVLLDAFNDVRPNSLIPGNFTVELTKAELIEIADATVNSKQPLDKRAIDEVIGNDSSIVFDLELSRSRTGNNNNVSLALISTKRDDNLAYFFEQGSTSVPTGPKKSEIIELDELVDIIVANRSKSQQ